MDIGDMLNFEIQDAPMQSSIETDTVVPMNPYTDSTKVFRFRINNTGFLDSTSMLNFRLTKSSTAGGGDRLRVNIFNGVLGGIQRARMTTGDYEICNTEDVFDISTARHLNTLPRQMREQLMGFYLGNQVECIIDESAGTDNNTNGTDRKVGQWRLSHGVNGIDFGQQNDGTGNDINSNSIVTTEADNDMYGIPLHLLFPALEGRQLPLFMFQDHPIILEVEFRNPSKYVNKATGHPSYAAADSDVVIRDMRMTIDYVLPPAVVIAQYQDAAASEGGYKFEYPKWVLVKKALPAQNASKEPQSVEHRLGQEGKEVHMIIQTKRMTAAKAAADTADKLCLDSRVDGVDVEEYNVEVNGENVYPNFVWNNASQYNELSQCLDAPLQIPRPMYFTDPNSLVAHQACIQSGLVGSYKPLGCDMRNGEPVVNGGGTQIIQGAPLIWKYKRDAHNAIADIQIDYDVAYDVSYHIMTSGLAVIKKLPLGTSVQVKA